MAMVKRVMPPGGHKTATVGVGPVGFAWDDHSNLRGYEHQQIFTEGEGNRISREAGRAGTLEEYSQAKFWRSQGAAPRD